MLHVHVVTTGLQLAMYDTTKQSLQYRLPEGYKRHAPYLTALWAGIFTALLAHPLDVILVRVYHQHGRDLWYSSPLDAALKTIKTEGLGGLYKGFSATFLRAVPHTTFTFILLENLRGQAGRR